MELNIYNKEGQLKATVSPADSSSLTEGLMTDYILSLSFVLFDCVQLDVNDYVDFLGKRYWILEAYIPNQKSTIEWNYSTKFYGIESVIRRALCLKTVDNEMNAVFSLTAPAIEHVRLVVQNINRVMGTTDWKVGEVEATANLTIDYNATYCDAALASIATAADTEYWIDGLTVNLCRCEHGELLSLGYENGLKEITLDTNENAKFFTRLFPLGSTRNIDPAVYGSGRLHLPGGVKYVEQNTHYGIIEHSEEATFSDIYPRRVGKVGIVRHETKKGEDGKDFDIYYFTDPDIDFDPNNYEIPNQKKNIVFETGDLAGRDFEVNYNADKKEFEIVTQFPYDDNTQLPGVLVMKPGNDYILYNITMPTEYYPRAEQEFATAVASYMEKNKRDKSVYKSPTDYIDLNKRKIVLTIGQRVHLMSDKYFPAVGYRDSRITKITRKVNETLQADIEISDLANPGGKAVLTQGISEAKHYAQVAMAGLPDMIKSWENTPASDSNLYTAKRTQKEFMSKFKPEQTEHLMKLLGGAHFGNFVPGMIGGSGASVTVDEYGKTTYEGDKLILREELIVPKITFNCIDVISGDKANTFSFGTIKSVDRENLIATLDLLEDQHGTLHASDILRGVFHNLEGGNQASDSYDNNGYLNYAGFSTSYFTPTEIIESKPGVMAFRYALQSGTSVHPMPGMNFFGYGNFTDKDRQAITYENRYYTRRLKKVNTWVINPDKHIAMQNGLLEGLTIGGMVMHGHGTYMENCYLTGVQMQFTPEQKEEFQGQSAYSVNLSTYEGVLVVDDSGNAINGMQGSYTVVSGEQTVVTGDSTVVAPRFRLSTRIQAFRGTKELRYNTVMDKDSYVVTAYASGCEYGIVGGVLTVTKVTDVANAYIDIEVNCEGLALFTKHYQITSVLDGNSVWSTYHDGEEQPALPIGDGAQGGWHRNLTAASVWVSQKNTRLVTDGVWGAPIRLKGINGKDGDSAFALNLTSDTDAIACDSKGTPVGTGVLATTKAMLYVGGEYTDKGVSFAFAPTGCAIKEKSNSTGLVEVTYVSIDAATVEITALYKNSTTVRSYSLTKVRAGSDGENAIIYQLLPSADVIKRSIEGSITSLVPTALSCGVTKTDGAAVTRLSSIPQGYGIRYGATDGSLRTYAIDSNIDVSGYTTGIVFELLDGESVVIDREVIPVVSDGKDGTTGANGANGGQYVQMYKYSATQPTDNPGIYIYNTDAMNKERFGLLWTFAIPQPPVQVFDIKKMGLDDWRVSDGLYSSPITIGDAHERMKISFVTEAANQTVHLSALISAGVNCYGYVLKPDVDASANLTNTLFYSNYSFYNTLSVVIPTAGRHYIIVGYLKRGSAGQDLFQFRMLYPNKIWATTAFCLRSAGTMWEAQERWSTPTLYSEISTGCVLLSSVSQITLNSLGSLVPSSFVVHAKDLSGNNTARYRLTCWKSTNGTDWVRHSEATYVSSIQVIPSVSYIMYKVRATTDYADSYESKFIAEAQVNLVKDGSNEASGSMPRNCGEFVSGKSYSWDKDFRDITLLREGSVTTIWVVNVFGKAVTGRPSVSDPEWLQGNKELFTAIDLALIEGADIAGFLFKNGRMVSQDETNGIPNLSLDGKTGSIKAFVGEFGGYLSTKFNNVGSQWPTNIDLTSGMNLIGDCTSDVVYLPSAGKFPGANVNILVKSYFSDIAYPGQSTRRLSVKIEENGYFYNESSFFVTGLLRTVKLNGKMLRLVSIPDTPTIYRWYILNYSEFTDAEKVFEKLNIPTG